MSKNDVRIRNVSYWSSRSLQGALTLQAALKLAKASRPDWSSRVMAMSSNLAPDGSIFVNHLQIAHGMLFGEVVMFERGRHHHALNINAKKEALELVEIAPKIEDKDAHAEFLESLLYFGVLDDHVVVLQSRSLRSRDLENYLNWLLVDSEALGEDDGISLVRGIELATKEKITQNTPSKIRIGTALFKGKSSFDPQGTNQLHPEKRRVKLRGGIWPFLNSIAGKSLDNLKIDNSIDPDSISVHVEISYRRKSDDQAAKIMEDLTHSLRHLDEDDLSVTLPKTGVIKGNSLFISTGLSVKANNGNVVEQDLYRQMSVWLRSLIERNIVS